MSTLRIVLGDQLTRGLSSLRDYVPGDIVLIARGVSPELYETLLAVFRLGAVVMFPEPAAGLKGLRAMGAVVARAAASCAWAWRQVSRAKLSDHLTGSPGFNFSLTAFQSSPVLWPAPMPSDSR